MQNKIAVTLITVMLVCFLLFEAFYPSGFLYPYFAQQEVTSPHRKRKAPPIVPPIIPSFTGLAPQKVADTPVSYATRDTFQRKVFYNNVHFFVLYHYTKIIDETLYHYIVYTSSPDGLTWAETALVWGGYVWVPSFDIAYPNRGSKDWSGNDIDLNMFLITSVGSTGYRPKVISEGTLVAKTGADQGGQATPQGGSIHSNLNGANDYGIFHRDTTNNFIRTYRTPENKIDDSDASVPFGGTTSGGNQILPYKTSSPYKMLALAKGGDDKLYYNLVNEPIATFVNDSFIEIATLGTGFSDFCACSEAQNVGDPERIHLVYIKSTGELCYNKFEDDDFGVEKVLVASGASYPVIACGLDGRLYILYVKDGKIWLIKYEGRNWLGPLEFFTDMHTYNNPAYLSTNQNVQDGKICLVWTEGTEAPYEVWFSYVDDA